MELLSVIRINGKIDVFDVVFFAIEKIFKNWLFFLGLIIALSIVSTLFSISIFAPWLLSNSNSSLFWWVDRFTFKDLANFKLQYPWFTLASGIIFLSLWVMTSKLIGQAFQGKTVNLDTLSKINISQVIKILILYLMLFLTISLGLIFFIVPGVVYYLKFCFSDFIVLEENLGPIQAARKSSILSSNNCVELGWIALFVVTMTAIICCYLIPTLKLDSRLNFFVINLVINTAHLLLATVFVTSYLAIDYFLLQLLLTPPQDKCSGR